MKEAESLVPAHPPEPEPGNVNAWIGWCCPEEVRRNIPRAWELLAEAEKVAPESADLSVTRALLYGREKKNEEAVAELSKSKDEGKIQQIPAISLLERGRLYDKMNRFDEAWADFVEGKRLCRDVQGRRYAEPMAKNQAERLKRLLHAPEDEPAAQGDEERNMLLLIFIVGFPRSSTTMVEQTLTAHPEIAAGDELVYHINDLARIGSRWLGSPPQLS